MAAKVDKKGEKLFLGIIFEEYFKKKYCFYAFFSGNSVFLRHIINEKIKGL